MSAVDNGMRRRDRRRASRLYAAAGATWIFLHLVGALGPLSSVTFVVLTLSSITACVLGMRRYRPRLRWPFLLIVVGFVLFVAGGAARENLKTLGDLSPHRSFVPDMLTLPGYVLVGIALIGFSRARRGGAADLDALLDGLLAALASLAFVWTYLITPALRDAHAPWWVRFVLVCYPAMSLIFVAIAMQIVSVGGRSDPSHRLILLGMVVTLIGDVVYMLVDSRIATIPTRVVDVPYAIAAVSFGACALHPSMRQLCEPIPVSQRTPTRTRLVLVAIALALPTLVVISRIPGRWDDEHALIAISVALTSFAIVRVFRALRAHARSAELLTEQATHDALTGLPNRFLVFEQIDQTLARYDDAREVTALLFLDVDRFKLVNDSLGHTFGDDFIIAVADRLRRCAGDDTFVGRLGGDEFVLLLTHLTTEEQARVFADEVRSALSEPFVLGDAQIFSSVSIGVAVADRKRTTDAASLLRDADMAMYQAKSAGRDAVAVFDARIRDEAERRARLDRDLHTALERDELALHYQPIVDVASCEVVGFEALLRWNHPHFGTVPPLHFIPIAEESGLIVTIGAWALETASRQLVEWQRLLSSAQPLYVAVNVSARQLRDPAFVDMVVDRTNVTRLRPEALRLELTESLLVDQSSRERESLQRLRELGFRISIDDFGTGYSSLAYLRKFTVDEVKIDKSFIDDLADTDTSSESLVAAIVAMAHALGMRTTAEGVESTQQADRLRVLGVDAAQGYVFARPSPAEQVPDLVASLARSGPGHRAGIFAVSDATARLVESSQSGVDTAASSPVPSKSIS